MKRREGRGWVGREEGKARRRLRRKIWREEKVDREGERQVEGKIGRKGSREVEEKEGRKGNR